MKDKKRINDLQSQVTYLKIVSIGNILLMFFLFYILDDSIVELDSKVNNLTIGIQEKGTWENVGSYPWELQWFCQRRNFTGYGWRSYDGHAQAICTEGNITLDVQWNKEQYTWRFK